MKKSNFYLGLILIIVSAFFAELKIIPGLIAYKWLFTFLDWIPFLTGLILFVFFSEKSESYSAIKRIGIVIGVFLISYCLAILITHTCFDIV